MAIDGFASFWSTLESFDFGRQNEAFERLFSEGRSVGIHFVVTATQRLDLPHTLAGSVGVRLLQRLPGDGYAQFDVTNAPDPELMPPGRTLVVGGPEFQVAVAGRPEATSGPGQAAWISELATNMASANYPAPPPLEALGERVPLAGLSPAVGPEAVPIGRTTSLQPVTIDLAALPTFLVVGEGGSGRSTALATILASLSPVVDDRRVLVTRRSSPLRSDGRCGTVTATDVAEVVAALEGLKDEVEERARSGEWSAPIAVAIDDADSLLGDLNADTALGSLLFNAREAGLILLASATTFRAVQAYDTWFRELVSNGHGLLLQPDGGNAEDVFDVRFPRGQAVSFPPGRGYLVARSKLAVAHIAT